MKVAGIICEYNPFHNGHKRQIDEIRNAYGADTAIVAVMSGNYTQRGEAALFDKLLRAKAAVLAGVDLVLELPFPFCACGAEYFAKAGVGILSATGIVDLLSFGSECGDMKALSTAAKRLSSAEFFEAFENAKKENPKIGHPALTEKIYGSLYGVAEAEILKSPNNILAIEYIKAASALHVSFSFHTLKRNTDYLSEVETDSNFASAGTVRNMMINGRDFSSLIPNCVDDLYREAIKSSDFCLAENAVSFPILSSLLLNEASGNNVFDTDAGLYRRLHKAAKEATDLQTLLQLSETKKYTKARLRRAVLFAYFGVTSSDVKSGPAYIQVLAADGVGCSLLKQMKKTATLPILTKPCDVPKNAVASKVLSDKADSVYALSKQRPKSAKDFLAFTPYIKK